MSQFRQNPVTKQWVLIAPNRNRRFEDLSTKAAMPESLPEILDTCPFCPGNEGMNGQIGKFPDSEDWQVRVIPNKFEALAHIPFSRNNDFYQTRTGSGDHEVVITAKHNEPISLQSIQTVETVLEVFKHRLVDLSENQHVSYVQIFHNHGRDAGATMVHPHWQLLAVPFVPNDLSEEMHGAYHYHQINKSCIYCDILREEQRTHERIIFETEEFLTLAPYASRSPFETWIIPKRHMARYEELDATQIKDLAYVLKVTAGQLFAKMNDPAFNIYIHTLPFAQAKHIAHNESSYHWHMTVSPRLSTAVWGGFEYGTGIAINSVAPESAAEFLR